MDFKLIYMYLAKKLRKLCLRGNANDLRYFLNFEYQNILICIFLLYLSLLDEVWHFCLKVKFLAHFL